jgi:endonuclease/exonuclease/phosphatase family metal-dependent hydrolase
MAGRAPPGAAAASSAPGVRARVACWFYAARGRCRFGAGCRFAHEPPAATPGAAPGTARRGWVVAAPAGAGPPPTPLLHFRVVSYNTLADELAFKHAPELYRAVPRAALAWRARCAGLRAELAHWAADVVCLQEVDRPADVAAFLREAGYDFAYAPRTGGRADGCMTGWKRGRFALAAPARTLAMADHGLKDNVALLTLLKPVGVESVPGEAGTGGGAAGPLPPPPPPTLLIANTHLLFNPKRGDLKLGQARTLLAAMAAEAAAGGAAHALLAGDLNATPASAVYAFVARGELALDALDRRALSGQLVGSRAAAGAVEAESARLASAAAATTPAGDVDTDDEFAGAGAGAGAGPPSSAPPPPPPPYCDPMTLDPRPARGAGGAAASWTADQFKAAAGSPRAGDAGDGAGWVARHPLRLASAHAAAAGCEPAFTSAHGKFVGTVDYVWFTPAALGGGRTALAPTRVLAPPPLASLPAGLPSLDYPSDHVSVVVDFVATEAGSREGRGEAGVGGAGGTDARVPLSGP